jgi:hypothetical protein
MMKKTLLRKAFATTFVLEEPMKLERGNTETISEKAIIPAG